MVCHTGDANRAQDAGEQISYRSHFFRFIWDVKFILQYCLCSPGGLQACRFAFTIGNLKM